MKSDQPIKGLKAKVHRSKFDTVQRIYSIKERFKGPDAEATARAFLKRFAEDLGIDPQLKDLKFDKVKRSLLGEHVLFQQLDAGRPVSGAWIRVDIGPDGLVFNAQNDMIPTKAMKRARPRVPEEAITEGAARNAAMAAITADSKRAMSAELVTWRVKDLPVLAWKVIVRTSGEVGQWRVYVRATNGAIINKRNMIKEAVAWVFDPTPIAKLDRLDLKKRARQPDDAYVEVKLLGLKGNGFLDGKHVTTSLTRKRVKRTNGDFRFLRTEAAFREVMVYYHIDSAARHLEAIGCGGIFDSPIKVKVDGTREDNSWYDPEDRTLTFGTGGVDDPEDAEIILHEYAHAIQDAQVPGWGWGHESAAMGEGFGDYFAANFFHDKKPQSMRATVFNWDFLELSRYKPPYGRRLDTDLPYPPKTRPGVHRYGCYWSACLWELRALLTAERAERLIIAHHHLLSKHSTFADGAHALLTANERMYDDKDRAAIRAVFERRGIIEPK